MDSEGLKKDFNMQISSINKKKVLKRWSIRIQKKCKRKNSFNFNKINNAILILSSIYKICGIGTEFMWSTFEKLWSRVVGFNSWQKIWLNFMIQYYAQDVKKMGQ